MLVRQDWKYVWRVQGGASPWTADEKTAYHHAVDKLIWAFWSFRARLLVAPTAPPATNSVAHALLMKFPNLGLTLSFDIRRVTIRPHWHATVTKVDPAIRPRHLALVIETLGKMVPGCKFVAAVTR